MDDYVIEAAVARCSREGWSQKKIAQHLNTTQSQVSRMLKNSRFLRTEFVAVPPAGISKDEFTSRIDELLGHGKVRPLLKDLSHNSNFKVDVVFDDLSSSSSRSGFDLRVGRHISRLIDRAKIVGVTWEKDIAPPASQVNIGNFVNRQFELNEDPVEFVPLSGLSLDTKDSLEKSSTVIALRYHLRVNIGYEGQKNCPRLYNMNCIPLALPGLDTVDSKQTTHLPASPAVREYLTNAYPDYTRIFGDLDEDTNSYFNNEAKANKVDTIISGIGSTEKDLNRLLKFLFPPTRINKDELTLILPDRTLTLSSAELKNYIAGDIAGILLPKVNQNFLLNSQVAEQLNRRLATLKPGHLLNCCQRAKENHAEYSKRQSTDPSNKNTQKSSPAGVVVIASGEHSANALLSAIACGYVTRVIIDYNLYSELQRRADLRPQTLEREKFDLLQSVCY